MAIQSKRLATIITDVPVEFDESIKTKEPNKEALKELFAELEFRKLAEQVLGEKIIRGRNDLQLSNAVQETKPATATQQGLFWKF